MDYGTFNGYGFINGSSGSYTGMLFISRNICIILLCPLVQDTGIVGPAQQSQSNTASAPEAVHQPQKFCVSRDLSSCHCMVACLYQYQY